MTEHAIMVVENAPVIAKRLKTNLLSDGKSAIRSCKSRGNSLHLRSGVDEKPALGDGISPVLCCCTGKSMKGRRMEGARMAPSP